MKNKTFFFFIQIVLNFIFIFFNFFSIILQPLNIILGIICILFLPGYNIISALRNEYSFLRKLGYSFLVSLAIENVILFLSYILLYNFLTWPDGPVRPNIGVFFNPSILNISFQIISLIFLLLYRKKSENDKEIVLNISQFKKKVNFQNTLKNLKNKKTLALIIYFSCLFLTCFITFLSHEKVEDFKTNWAIYRANFIFFERVSLLFYPFLIISVILLVYIILNFRNKYLILFTIAIFLYCLWILPYLQIGYYINYDSHYTYLIYDHYLERGVTFQGSYGFCIVPKYGTQRYSTSLFVAIILTGATSVDINFAMWYLFPIIFMGFPFFFYSIFNNFSIKRNNTLNSLILTLFTLFTPQFIKSGHNASTGMIGIWIFFLLVIELFEMVKNKEITIKNCGIIIFFYIFLCLTHIEECFYFLILLILCTFYYSFMRNKSIDDNYLNLLENCKEKQNKAEKIISTKINNEFQIYRNYKEGISLLILLTILTFIFYLIFEFFGWIYYHFGTKSYLSLIYKTYASSKVNFPLLLRGEMEISLVVLLMIFLMNVILIALFKFFLIKKFYILKKLYLILIKLTKRIFKPLNKIFSKKIFPFVFFPGFLALIILIDMYNITTLEESLLNSILGLVLSYFITVFQLFLFIKGFKYYQIDNKKQNYFLLAIIACSGILIYFLITGYFFLAFYILHTKFLTYLLFFNMLIIQNTYFLDYMKQKRKYLTIIMLLTVFLGIFSSLRTLAYG